MAAFPTVTAERGALLDELAALIEECGVDAFVAAPVLEPDDRFFPDAWTASQASVDTLAKRLLGYAKLPETVAVVLPDQVDDALLAVATVAHEVARVYRQFHELDAEPPSDATVSLTTIYLGFGVITTNASYRYRAKGEQRGQLAVTQWSHQRFGGLSPEDMSFLLATQLAARDATSSAVRAVERQLETNQRSYFEDAYRELMPDPVAERLRLPARATWPAAWPLPPAREGGLVKAVRGALAKNGDALPTAAVVKGGRALQNAQRATFRIIGHASGAGFGLGLLGAVAIFCLVAFVMSQRVSGPPLARMAPGLIVAMLLGPPTLGLIVGRTRRRDFCSDPTCNAPLPLPATTCARCGGTIKATLKDRNERLDAEERLGLNRADYDIDVGSESTPLAPGAKALFAPVGVAGGLIGAGVHEDEPGTERGGSSTVI